MRVRSKGSSRQLVVHAKRFAKYIGDTDSLQPASDLTTPSKLRANPTADSPSKAAGQTKPHSQTTPPPPLRFAKYTAEAAKAIPSGVSSEANGKSADRVSSQSTPTTQSTLPTSLRFAQYTTKAGSSGSSSLTSEATNKSAHKATTQSKAPSQSATRPPLRFAKYTAKAANAGSSGLGSEATSKSAIKAPPQRLSQYTAEAAKAANLAIGSTPEATSKSAHQAPTQSATPPPLRFAKYTAEAASPGQPASGTTASETGPSRSTAPGQSSSPSSAARSASVDKQDSGSTSNPFGEISTEGNRANDRQVGGIALAVEGGRGEAADAAQEGLDQLVRGISDATDQATGDTDQSVQDALGLVGDVEETLDKAAGQAEQVSDAADQMQSIKPGAADTAADLTDSLQSDKPTSLMTAMDSQWEAVQHSIHSVAEAIVAIKQNLAAGDLLEQAGNGKRVKAGSDQLPDVKKKENIVNRTENVPQLSQLSSAGDHQSSHHRSDTSEAKAGTGAAQQTLPGSPGVTLEHVVEELRLLLKREKVPEDLPAEAGPAKYPYTNNSVADFSDMAEARAEEIAAFTVTPEYGKSVGFQLISGASGTGKTRMGTEIRRLVAQQSSNCTDKQKAFWQTGQAVFLDFSVTGDPITPEDAAIPPTCMLGLRIAARNIFHCSLPDMQQHLPLQLRHLFTLRGVMRLLARQKRDSLGLTSDAVILQVITVDDMQLLSHQSEGLSMKPGVLANTMVTELAAWMVAGV
ncbi:hypothetical protein ABBQ32_005642 [Trebouxia sp. C0010 RCD-2024]